MQPTIRIGSVVGTGAAINVSLGFKPDYVEIINITDRTRRDTWILGMPAAASVKEVTTGGPISLTTNGISQFDGAAANVGDGFTIGSDISTSGKTLAYVAMRRGAGAQG